MLLKELKIALLFAVSLFVCLPALAQEDSNLLDIQVGRSVVITLPRIPSAIAITDPDVAMFTTLGTPTKVQVQGKNIGSTDLMVNFGAGSTPSIYEVIVHRDLSELIRRIDSVVEGTPPRVYPLGDRIVVEGAVEDLDTLEQVALVSRIYDESFVNLMSVRGDHQVQLEVLFAEVSRTGARELGLNILYGDGQIGAGMLNAASGSTKFTNPRLSNSMLPAAAIGSPINGGMMLGGFVQQINLTAVLGLLDEYRLGKILAQPTIVSLSGQQSEFHAGGEIPIPVPQGGTSNRISIEYKEYGIKLVFVPTVLANDIIDVRMFLEISELDYASASQVNGISVPGFTTRKGSHHLRLQNGMTFAVAGLLSDRNNYARVGIPGLGRIPILGALFRTVRHVREETEVVIYVTPRLVRPLAAGEVPAAPGTIENNNPSDFELFLLGLDHRPNSRTAEPTGAVGLQRR